VARPDYPQAALERPQGSQALFLQRGMKAWSHVYCLGKKVPADQRGRPFFFTSQRWDTQQVALQCTKYINTDSPKSSVPVRSSWLRTGLLGGAAGHPHALAGLVVRTKDLGLP
jgi:hypothetical protein